MSAHIVNDIAAEIIAEQEAQHLREIRRLDDLAFILLRGADGDPLQAEKTLDDFIDVLFEGGALILWKYRIVLAKIRKGM